MSTTPENLNMAVNKLEESPNPCQPPSEASGASETSISCIHGSVHVCSLPEDIAVGIEGLTSSPERHVALISALRILDYRRRGFETSVISATYGDELLSLKKIDVSVDGNTLVAHVIQATRNEIADLSQVGSLSDQVCAAVDADDSAISWLFSASATARCSIVYESALHPISAIQNLATQFSDIVRAVLFMPQIPIIEIPFSGVLRQLRYHEHPLREPIRPILPETLVHGFNSIVAEHGSAIAVTQGNFVCTYKDLDTVTTLLAHELLSRRGSEHQSDEVIAYCIPPSPMAIITMLAIVKTGCAYVPIDVRQAEDRAITMLEALENPCVVTYADSPSFVRSSTFKSTTIDITEFLTNWQTDRSTVKAKLVSISKYNNVACVLFTSGTTGTPKGVRVLQKSILSLAADKEAMPFMPGDRVAQVNNLAWDAHIIDIWCALLRGATVVSFSRFDVLDPAILTRQFATVGVTACLLSSTLFRHMLTNGPKLLRPLRVLLTGGEMGRYVDFAKAKEINPGLTIHNLYGPTEGCVYVTNFPVKMSSDFPKTGTVPVGFPINGAQLVLLDSRGQIVPPGVIGEINIRGAGVADGYLGEKETKSAFVERHIPGLTESLSTFYRTGDLGRWNSTGHMEIMGRINSNQIKIRGQRLEVDEVEATIADVAGMKEVAVAYHRAHSQVDGRLIGYVVPPPESEHFKAQARNETVLVEAWEEHYDTSYSQDDITKIRTQFMGWDSMITGQPIPHEEMQAWLDDTRRPFSQYQPRKVFEIGCGIGIVLYNMIAEVDHFYGIEPSGTAVQQLKHQLAEDGFADKASIWHAPADQLSSIPEFDADMIVINSVAQYFPSLAYFKTVLTNAVSRTKPGGHILLGDIRSAPLHDLLVLEILLERWKSSLSVKTVQMLRDEVHKRQQYSTELMVDPTFFFDLQRDDPRITHVEIVPKITPYANELTRYRYQVILHVGGEPRRLQSDRWLSPDEQNPFFENLPELLREFIASDSLFLALERIPNRILQSGMSMVEAVSETSTLDKLPLETLISTSSKDERGLAAFDLENYAKAYGLGVKLSCARQSEGGILDAVFTKLQVRDCLVDFPAPRRSSVLQINKDRESIYPRTRLDRTTWIDIKARLSAKLPDFMIPETLYVVDQIPVTLYGKTDRKVIARMAAYDCDLIHQTGHTEALITGCRSKEERLICELFAKYLGCRNISPSTNFFHEGGHSLLATQLRNAVQKQFGVSIPLMQLYETPTPAQLTLEIKALPQTEDAEMAHIEDTDELEELHDLSNAQFRLWFLDQLNPGDRWYNSPLVLRCEDALDEDVLEQTIKVIAERHDILRTVFIVKNGMPKSLALKETPRLNKLEIIGVEDEEMVWSIVSEHAIRPFNISREPPFRPTLFTWRGQHILLLSMHHIITDGFSNSIWRKELATVYPALLGGLPVPLPPLPIQYQDYAQWQRSPEHQELLRPQLDYWVNHLQGTKPARFPVDFPRTSSLGPGESHSFKCDKALKEKLEVVCMQYRVTWFMLLMASFRAVHFQSTGQRDGSFGSPIANRHRQELEPLLGFFVNTQVFRLPCQKGMSFLNLLSDTKEHALKAFENQDVPFDSLVQILSPDRSAVQNPIVELMFAFQTHSTQPFDMGGITWSIFGTDTKASRFDLEVHWSEKPDHLECAFFYRTEVFKKETIETLAHDTLEFLEIIADDPTAALMTDKVYDETLDMEGVPLLEPQFGKAPVASGPDGPPLNEIETKICKVFEEVLERGPITRQSNFFDNGGHSILVSLACSKLTEIFETPIGIRDFFSSPTPASLGEIIQVLVNDPKQTTGEDEEEILPTHFVFNKVPNKPLLFCLPTHTGLGNVYSHLAMASQSFTVVALNDPFLRGVGLTGERDPSSFTLQELAEIYYQTVTGLDRDMADGLPSGATSQEEVPLNVLGYSLGGNVAIEVARLSQDDGRKVNLFLVDCADSAVSLDLDNMGLMEFNMADMPQDMYRESLQNSVKLSYEMVKKDSGAASHGLLTKDNMSKVRSCMEANHDRLFRHKTAYYHGSAVMFRSDGNALHGLHRKFDSLEEITLEGNHSSLLQHSMGQLELIVDRISAAIS